jgi:uncharacterized protein
VDRLTARRAGAGAGAGALALAGLGAWAGWIEPRRLVLRRRTLRLDPWPVAVDGLRVAVLADLHAGGPHMRLAHVERIARRLAAERPDLALLLGDFVDTDVLGGERLDPHAVAGALRALRPPLGAFAVLGNHDWVHEGGAVATALGAAGIRVLEDEAVQAGGVWLAGLADTRRRAPDVPATLAGVPDGAPLLVLAHDPDLFPQIPARASLTLSGHTHGGQVNVPGLRRWFIPSRFGARYAYGVIEEEGRRLLVTGGAGEAGLPVRLGRPSEALLLTLRAARGAQREP